MQLGSVLLSRDAGRNVFGAPLLFTICVDIHRMEKIMELRDNLRACGIDIGSGGPGTG
jgi:hypothetical protein